MRGETGRDIENKTKKTRTEEERNSLGVYERDKEGLEITCFD